MAVSNGDAGCGRAGRAKRDGDGQASEARRRAARRRGERRAARRPRRPVRTPRTVGAAAMSIEEIIAKVKARPELWQTAHPFYKHRFVTNRIWLEIANELNIEDCSFLKKRWKHLKDTFRKEVKKVMSNQVTMSSWLHYNELEFLTDELIKRPEQPKESEESEASDSDYKPIRGKKVMKRYDKGPASRMDSKAQSSIKFKRIMRSLYMLSKAINKTANSKPSEEQYKNDTDYMFLVSLLPTMQSLTDVQRLQFRGRINNWLLNALTENEYTEECDSKAYVQAQINNINIA